MNNNNKKYNNEMYSFHNRHSLDPNSIETVNQNTMINQSYAVSTKAYRCGVCYAKIAAYQFHYHRCTSKKDREWSADMKDVGCLQQQLVHNNNRSQEQEEEKEISSS